MTGMAIERDFRKLALATQAELRRVAVAMVRAGKTRIEAAEAVGVNRRFVGQWVKAAAQSGEAVLAGRRRGRRPGEQKALSAAQEDRLRGVIARGCPDQVGLSFTLWTRQAVRALIGMRPESGSPCRWSAAICGPGCQRQREDASAGRSKNASRGIQSGSHRTP